VKYWTEHQARTQQLAQAEQLSSELRTSQSAITALDRTQAPQSAYSAANISDNSARQVWATNFDNPLWGTAGTLGEQTNFRSAAADTIGYQFRALQYQGYAGGWHAAHTMPLNGFRGGHLFIEWSGLAAVFLAFSQTANNDHPPNPRYLNLRIRVGGVTMVENIGCARTMGNFRTFGSGLYPSGDLVVSFEFRFTLAGQDDAVVSQGVPVKNLMQAHLFGCKALAIARYR